MPEIWLKVTTSDAIAEGETLIVDMGLVKVELTRKDGQIHAASTNSEAAALAVSEEFGGDEPTKRAVREVDGEVHMHTGHFRSQ